jgi:hypothetical protein
MLKFWKKSKYEKMFDLNKCSSSKNIQILKIFKFRKKILKFQILKIGSKNTQLLKNVQRKIEQKKQKSKKKKSGNAWGVRHQFPYHESSSLALTRHPAPALLKDCLIVGGPFMWAGIYLLLLSPASQFLPDCLY